MVKSFPVYCFLFFCLYKPRIIEKNRISGIEVVCSFLHITLGVIQNSKGIYETSSLRDFPQSYHFAEQLYLFVF